MDDSSESTGGPVATGTEGDSGSDGDSSGDGASETTGEDCPVDTQDNDMDGTCEPACVMASCGENGTCDDTSGSIICACDAEYDGDACGQCADGFQDGDGDGECAPACAEDSCSGHGTCNDTSGLIACSCDPEYIGDLCDQCATDFQDNDGDAECTAACVPDSCSGNGTCDDSSGVAECTCSGLYSGDACDACVPNVLLIDDPFEDGDIATGGPGSTNAGLIYVDNGTVDGVLEEIAGLARISTPTPGGGAEPNIGGYSVNTFDGTLADGVTLVAEVSAADTPMWNGIVLSLNGDPGLYETAGRPGLEFHVRSSSVDLRANIQGLPNEIYANTGYDAAALADGFTLVLSASPTGWSYTVDGLMLGGAQLVDSGTWTAGYGYADLLDAASHAGIAIQGDNSDGVPRVLDTARLTVFEGICEGVLPTLP